MVGCIMALEYHERSKKTISPFFGNAFSCVFNQFLFCSSDGVPSSYTLKCLGMRCSMNRLMVDPFPAASLPSNTMAILLPYFTTHS